MFSKHVTTDSTYPIKKILKIYEALRGFYEPEKLMEEISFQAERRGIITEEGDGEILAVAFIWHIADPYDVVDRDWNYPGESIDGKYLYLPLLWVKNNLRSYGFLKKFLLKLLAKHPGAKRIAFRRVRPRDDKRLHILMRFNGHATPRYPIAL